MVAMGGPDDAQKRKAVPATAAEGAGGDVKWGTSNRRKSMGTMLKKVKGEEDTFERDEREGLRLLREASGGAAAAPKRVPHGGTPSATEIAQYGLYLGLKYPEDAALVWVAEQAILAPLPEGWSEHVAPGGKIFYYHEKTDTSQPEHPADGIFREMIKDLKAKRDAKQERQRQLEEAKREEKKKEVMAGVRAALASGGAGGGGGPSVAPSKMCTPDEVRDMGRFLGVHPEHEPHLLWLARDALAAGLPAPWTEHEDDYGPYYHNPQTGVTTRQHPSDVPMRGKIVRIRAAVARGLRGTDEDYARASRYLAISPALDIAVPGPAGEPVPVWWDFLKDQRIAGPYPAAERSSAAKIIAPALRGLFTRYKLRGHFARARAFRAAAKIQAVWRRLRSYRAMLPFREARRRHRAAAAIAAAYRALRQRRAFVREREEARAERGRREAEEARVRAEMAPILERAAKRIQACVRRRAARRALQSLKRTPPPPFLRQKARAFAAVRIQSAWRALLSRRFRLLLQRQRLLQRQLAAQQAASTSSVRSRAAPSPAPSPSPAPRPEPRPAAPIPSAPPPRHRGTTPCPAAPPPPPRPPLRAELVAVGRASVPVFVLPRPAELETAQQRRSEIQLLRSLEQGRAEARARGEEEVARRAMRARAVVLLQAAVRRRLARRARSRAARLRLDRAAAVLQSAARALRARRERRALLPGWPARRRELARRAGAEIKALAGSVARGVGWATARRRAGMGFYAVAEHAAARIQAAFRARAARLLAAALRERRARAGRHSERAAAGQSDRGQRSQRSRYAGPSPADRAAAARLAEESPYGATPPKAHARATEAARAGRHVTDELVAIASAAAPGASSPGSPPQGPARRSPPPAMARSASSSVGQAARLLPAIPSAPAGPPHSPTPASAPPPTTASPSCPRSTAGGVGEAGRGSGSGRLNPGAISATLRSIQQRAAAVVSSVDSLEAAVLDSMHTPKAGEAPAALGDSFGSGGGGGALRKGGSQSLSRARLLGDV
eukprot:tig00021616_g22913.t1